MRELNPDQVKLENLLTDGQLEQLFGMNKQQIGMLRSKGLPYVRFDRNHRLYIEQDVMEWLLSKRIQNEV